MHCKSLWIKASAKCINVEDTPGPEMGVSDKGDMQNVQCWGRPGPGLRNTNLEILNILYVGDDGPISLPNLEKGPCSRRSLMPPNQWLMRRKRFTMCPIIPLGRKSLCKHHFSVEPCYLRTHWIDCLKTCVWFQTGQWWWLDVTCLPLPSHGRSRAK